MLENDRALCTRLAELVNLLNGVEEAHWLEWFSKALVKIENGDGSGYTNVLGAYGGMGSFNDLIIHPSNGHAVSETVAEQLDKRLDILRSDIYQLVRSK
jgi:hypothetical protein